MRESLTPKESESLNSQHPSVSLTFGLGLELGCRLTNFPSEKIRKLRERFPAVQNSFQLELRMIYPRVINVI